MTLQYPPPSIVDNFIQPIQGIPRLSTNLSPHQRGRLCIKSFPERPKTVSIQFLQGKSKTLSVPTPSEGVKTPRVQLVSSLVFIQENIKDIPVGGRLVVCKTVGRKVLTLFKWISSDRAIGFPSETPKLSCPGIGHRESKQRRQPRLLQTKNKETAGDV